MIMGIAGYFLILYLFIVALFNFSAPTRCDTEEGSEIGYPWIDLGNKLYLISNGAKFNWHAAANLCRSYDSFLVTIESDEEMDNLNSYLTKGGHDNQYWTSGNCLGQGRTFYSLSNGRPLAYLRWNAEQPNNLEDNQNCMEIRYNDGSFAMNDFVCSEELHYICEKRKITKTEFETKQFPISIFPAISQRKNA